MCVCSFFIQKCPPDTRTLGMQDTKMYAIDTVGLDVCIPVISFRIEAHNTFFCVWYYIWKNKILC